MRGDAIKRARVVLAAVAAVVLGCTVLAETHVSLWARGVSAVQTLCPHELHG
jgi:hypothetical protein